MKIIVAGTGFVGPDPRRSLLGVRSRSDRVRFIDKRKIADYESGDADRIQHWVNEPGLVNLINENKGRYLSSPTRSTTLLRAPTRSFSACRPRRSRDVPRT